MLRPITPRCRRDSFTFVPTCPDCSPGRFSIGSTTGSRARNEAYAAHLAGERVGRKLPKPALHELARGGCVSDQTAFLDDADRFKSQCGGNGVAATGKPWPNTRIMMSGNSRDRNRLRAPSGRSSRSSVANV
jgi:hypothetical protein